MSTHQPGKRALCAKYFTQINLFSFMVHNFQDLHVSMEFLQCPEQKIFGPDSRRKMTQVIDLRRFDSHFDSTSLHSTQLNSNQALYLLFFLILFFGRDKSCLNLTLLLNTHRYQLKVPLRPVFLFVAGKSLHPDIPPLVLHCIAMQLHFIQCPFVALSCIDLVTRF